MNRNLPVFILLAAAAGLAAAQDVYRCGDSYSQKPCPGGALVPTDDARSAIQRSQAKEDAQRVSKAADAMEKARLKEEAKAAVYLPPPRVETETAAEEQRFGVARPKKSEYFTAHAPRKPGEPPRKKKTKTKKKENE